MPTRRLVVALTLLLVSVFGVGIVTALGRVGDDDATPNAQPSSSTFTQEPFTPEPTTAPPTEEPAETPTPEPTSTRQPNGEPTAAPTGVPTVAPTGTAKPGVPGMPNTGLPYAVAVAATLLAGSALVVRRASAQ